MNDENQTQQEQHQLSRRVAQVETALAYQEKAIAALREEMQAGFARLESQMREGFSRVDARIDKVEVKMDKLETKIDKARTTDFRILLTTCLSTALGTFGLIIRAIGLI